MFSTPLIRSLYGQLVRDFGGVEAAAFFLECSKGTVSKEVSGQAAVSIDHAVRLEDALGRWPITEVMHRRRRDADGTSDLNAIAAAALREIGDVPPAVLDLVASGETGAAQKELAEARAAIEALERALAKGSKA
ncbi:MAG: hypothetical protein CMH12_03235 [Maritimibacter sp.]|nr:hypothetical protein [Maritimibacter sp.]